jgi:glycerophosphoryl diester phosphodiesterase
LENQFFTQTSSPKIIARHGGGGLWPENTIYAFEQAAAIGVDIIQIDVRNSADGGLVLMHDKSVERTTNGIGAVEQLTRAELQSLDAGFNWSDDGGETYPYRGQGITVPTITEAFRALPDMQLSIEIKSMEETTVVHNLCALINEHKASERVLVTSVSQETIQEFRTLCPDVATATSDKEMIAFLILNLTFLSPIHSPDYQVLRVPYQLYGIRLITPGLLRSAHDRGIAVYISLINGNVNMQDMLETGVDGIISDSPDNIIDALGNNSLLSHSTP